MERKLKEEEESNSELKEESEELEAKKQNMIS